MTIIMRDLMHGNPRLKELGFKEEHWAIMPSPVVSRDSVSGQTSILTATIQRLSSILHSTGMVSVRLSSNEENSGKAEKKF